MAGFAGWPVFVEQAKVGAPDHAADVVECKALVECGDILASAFEPHWNKAQKSAFVEQAVLRMNSLKVALKAATLAVDHAVEALGLLPVLPPVPVPEPIPVPAPEKKQVLGRNKTAAIEKPDKNVEKTESNPEA